MISDWTLRGADGETLLGATHRPRGEPVGVLILAHGFKGYKDYGFLPYLADAAAARGLIAHRFNFSHSGMTNRIEAFERPDLFERDTWSKQVYDLTEVVEAVERGDLDGQTLPLVLFGHSRGGVTALLTADAIGPRFAGLVTAAAPADACRLDDEAKAQLRAKGRLPSPSGRTGQTLYVGRPWLDEIEQNPDAVDPVRAIARIGAPILLLHGSADDTVAPTDADRLAHAAPHATQRIIEGASHTFNCPNPLPTDQLPPPATQQLVAQTIDFALDACRNP